MLLLAVIDDDDAFLMLKNKAEENKRGHQPKLAVTYLICGALDVI